LASQARVINTSSVAHKLFGRLDINDLDPAKKYSANRAYGSAKLANIPFTKELHRRFNSHDLTTAAFHRGGVATDFSAGSASYMRFLYESGMRSYMLTAARGALTLIWRPIGQPGLDWQSGDYDATRKPDRASRRANDAALAAQLWDRSEELVGKWLQ